MTEKVQIKYQTNYFKKTKSSFSNIKDLSTFMLSPRNVIKDANQVLKAGEQKYRKAQCFRSQTNILKCLIQKKMLQKAEEEYTQVRKLFNQLLQKMHYNREQINEVTKKQEELIFLIQELEQKKNSLNQAIKSIKEKYDEKIVQINKLDKTIEDYRQNIEDVKEKNLNFIEETQKTYRDSQMILKFIKELRQVKKRYNNQLQQIKGNIRVYCRIRPLLDIKQGNLMDYQATDSNIKINIPKNLLKSVNHQNEFSFSFQQIFDRQITQKCVFQELTQLIQSSISGKNVCIFAYGQTGSGKTYTMQGNCSTSSMKIYQQDNQGIIQKSIKQIFQQSQLLYPNHKRIIQVSALEIYNDTIKDLYDFKNTQMKIGADPQRIQIQSIQQGLTRFNTAISNRIVASTDANELSSRSHLIFTIHIVCKLNENEVKGSLTLVDLAGSQRILDSNVTGQRLKQTKHINSSLSALAKVISSIRQKSNHIPYRDTKLTSVLQNYLKNDSKAVMFVNISSNQNDLNQTINSLKFAAGVKECQL